MSGASVQVTLTRGVSDENPGDEFGGLGFPDDPIWVNGFDVISVSRVKKIPFEEPTSLSIRVMGTTFSFVTPTHFALHPTVNHPTYHHSS